MDAGGPERLRQRVIAPDLARDGAQCLHRHAEDAGAVDAEPRHAGGVLRARQRLQARDDRRSIG
jgi:hypothetical protein